MFDYIMTLRTWTLIIQEYKMSAKLLGMCVLKILVSTVWIKKKFYGFSAKIVNFEKTDTKDREIRDDTHHYTVRRGKNVIYKIGIPRPQSSMKVIVVAF